MALSKINDRGLKSERGMVLSEVLLAGAVMSFALASTIIVVGGLQSMLSDMQNGYEAQLKIDQEIAMAHMTAFDDLGPYQKYDGFFTTRVSVTYRNAFTANITVEVSWPQGVSRKRRVGADQIVDWRHASGGPSCDWLDKAEGDLSLVNFGGLNIDEGNTITDAAALGHYVYVSADAATSSLSDLYAVDVQDIHNPKIVGHLNTGPGIASITAAGHDIFAANAGSFEMQIIDISDPRQPSLVAQAKLPGAVVSGSSGYGHSVHYFDHKMFIGLTKNAGPEFYVVDVSQPEAPVSLGAYEIGSTVNDIDVQTGRAALVTPGQTSVFLLDISRPSSISEIEHAGFLGWQTQGAESVKMLGSRISVGRTLGGFYSPYSELMSLDRGQLATTSLGQKIGASVEDILAFNDYLYLATNDTAKTFQVWRQDNGSLSAGTTVGLSAPGIALTCNDQALYVVTHNDQDFFHIFSLP